LLFTILKDHSLSNLEMRIHHNYVPVFRDQLVEAGRVMVTDQKAARQMMRSGAFDGTLLV